MLSWQVEKQLGKRVVETEKSLVARVFYASVLNAHNLFESVTLLQTFASFLNKLVHISFKIDESK